MYIPTRLASQEALAAFMPNAGKGYGIGRNYVNHGNRSVTVSGLSPWIRTRLLPEWEVLQAVLQAHAVADVGKFIDEVCWRTYWKGWLELRPLVWNSYLEDCAALRDAFAENPDYLRAISGSTGIQCFDTWSRELIERNYLHNHVRMWYASIWVHTLKLPWQLGANWFLRHLLDGDAASNTLSWRWVAGIHTRGKSYLARSDNIRKYTYGRFEVTDDLATEPVVLDDPGLPSSGCLPPPDLPSQGQCLGLLVTDDDLNAEQWLREQYPVVAVAGLFPISTYQAHSIAATVTDFRRSCVLSVAVDGVLEDQESVLRWVEVNNLNGVLIAEPVVGLNRPMIQSIKERLEASGVHVYTARHWWDETLFPHATHGFFKFKKAIPSVLNQL